jgi:anti-sigma regulatory factor (Ser/Thr protein kinase)
MRELSLHILDIIENSIRAGASIIAVGITENVVEDLLEITVEDNGSGLNIPVQDALDPFHTTKDGKRTGLGLSLFRAAAEQAGGNLAIEKSDLGGVAVRVSMNLSHIDRRPLGDLAATLSSVVCTNPDLDLWCRFSSGGPECMVRVSDVARELQVNERCGLAIARRVSEKIRNGLAAMSGRS